jgi:hypothetical protein
VLAVSSSYYRFIITDDFLVSYEGFCDTSTESCFEGSYYDEECECDVIYEYKYVEKKATVYKNQMTQCSSDPYIDPMDCEEVNYCAQEEDDCAITYCDSEIEQEVCSG